MSQEMFDAAADLWASGAHFVWREDADAGTGYLGTGERLLTGSDWWDRVDDLPAAGTSPALLDTGRGAGAGERAPEAAAGASGEPTPSGTAARAQRWEGWLPYEAMTAALGVAPGERAHRAEAQPRFLLIEREWHFSGEPRPASPRPVAGAAPAGARWVHERGEYLEAIAAAQQAIRDGEVFVLCLTTRVEVPGRWDGLATYLALREANPTAHLALMRLGDLVLVAASPERFAELGADGALRTHPIKGTRPRGATPEQDRAEAAALAVDPKERAENVMIVDVARNDLSRVCEPGTVRVERLWGIDSYAGVHQLVSEVAGRVADGVSVGHVIRALVPGCSMTGAPKHRAAQLIAHLEPEGRGVYSGAFGTLRSDGTLELAMAIRCAVLSEDAAHVGVGGGITADSVPEREWDEVQLKARRTLSVLREARER